MENILCLILLTYLYIFYWNMENDKNINLNKSLFTTLEIYAKIKQTKLEIINYLSPFL